MNLKISKYCRMIGCLLIVTAAGCATSKDTLQLENVVQAEAERKARQEAVQAEEDKRAAETLLKTKTETEAGSEILSKTPQAIIANAKIYPPELEFLEISGSMKRLSPMELAIPAMKEEMQRIFPDLVAGWRMEGSSALLLGGLVRMQEEQLLSMTAAQFKESLQKVKSNYALFYEKQYGAPVVFSITEKGPLIFVSITSKYLRDGEWWTDKRLIYFYKPEYRLNLLVTGREADLARVKTETDQAVKVFEERLAQYFTKGIGFREA